MENTFLGDVTVTKHNIANATIWHYTQQSAAPEAPSTTAANAQQ